MYRGHSVSIDSAFVLPKTVNRRLSGWLELVGALTGVLIPLVYAAALSQADIAV